MTQNAKLSLTVNSETISFTQPFRISGYTFNDAPVVVATLSADGLVGRGEASGVYYRAETCATMMAEIETNRAAIEDGITRSALRRLMRAGGARNAIDCALWELEARLEGRPVWQIAGISRPRPLLTTFTLGADTPERMVEDARAFGDARALKLKLTGEDVALDAERVRAIWSARPDLWLAVDANQGFTPDTLEALIPTLVEAQVKLIEQPFAVGRESDMAGLKLPIPTAADESMQALDDLESLVGRFDIVNIKLDKCGGLTEALMIAKRARELGLGVMVGNMIGTSWAMAPAFVVGQFCDVVDLDGPVYMTQDRKPGVTYDDGYISSADAVWGGSDLGSDRAGSPR